MANEVSEAQETFTTFATEGGKVPDEAGQSGPNDLSTQSEDLH